MKKEIKKRPTSCYCLKMRRATGDVTKFYDYILESSGVTVGQYSLLLNISRSDKGSLRELADMAELDRSTLARNIKPLLNKNLVQDVRVPGARDYKLELTENGINTLEKAKGLWQDAQQAVEKKLGADGLKKFEQLLEVLASL